MDRHLLPILLLAGCQGPESGLDNSTLQGTVVIPPAAVEEGETRKNDNNDAGSAFGVGVEGGSTLTYRAVVLTGETNGFDASGRDEFGDADWYTFTPVADGTFSLSFSVPGAARAAGTDTDTTTTSTTGTETTDTTGTDSGTTGTDTDTTGTDTDTTGTDSGTTGTDTDTTGTDSGTTPTDTGPTEPTYVDDIVYTIRVYDSAAYDPADESAGLVAEGSTDGASGTWTGSFEVAAGADHLVLIGGVRNTTAEEKIGYQMIFSGSTPGEGSILVGAYAEGDPAVASNPLGGAAATLWTWDDATLTWTGWYTVQYLRSVVSQPEDTGSDVIPPPEIDEALDRVYLLAGSLTNLNKSPSAGSLYSSTSLEVAVPDGREILLEPIVLDAVFPKVIGQVFAETLPDTTLAEINAADYTLILETLVAQDLGMLTGLGYVDVVDGSSDVSSGAGGWNGANDSDAYAFTVPETMYVSMVAGWADPSTDLDFGIWGDYPPYGTIDYFSSFSASYCLSVANPEVCSTVVPLEPGITYYLVALGYQGSDVEEYHVELEWIAP